MKTTLNPEIKLTVLAIGLGLYSALPDKGELPIIHRYDGISGSTQGDKKDSIPAPNAIKTDMFSVMFRPSVRKIIEDIDFFVKFSQVLQLYQLSKPGICSLTKSTGIMYSVAIERYIFPLDGKCRI